MYKATLFETNALILNHAATLPTEMQFDNLVYELRAVASLGWVTPGAATEGVTPLFFPEIPGDLFFAHRCHYHYRFFLFSLRCHPLEGVTSYLFYLSDLVCPLFFVNLPTNNFFLRVSPPGGCHPGRSAPFPPSDATD